MQGQQHRETTSALKMPTRVPWIVHLNTGSCNGCDIEVLAALTLFYDTEHLGVKPASNSRRANIIVVTGALTKKAAEELRRLYEQIPDPKYVIAVGTCAISGNVFRHSYSVIGGVERAVPVDFYVPGCPPRPEAIIQGIVELLKKVEEEVGGD